MAVILPSSCTLPKLPAYGKGKEDARSHDPCWSVISLETSENGQRKNDATDADAWADRVYCCSLYKVPLYILR